MQISSPILFFFFFNDTATTEIYTLSLHDALPISPGRRRRSRRAHDARAEAHGAGGAAGHRVPLRRAVGRSGDRAPERDGGDEEPAVAADVLVLARAAEPGAQRLARPGVQCRRGAEGL